MQQKKTWFLRKTDGAEYGPVSLNDLLRWSAQCRLVAGNAVSADGEEWIPVESIPELEMNWVAHRADGKEYGPFALEAVPELFAHRVLPADAVLINRVTGEEKPLEQLLKAPDRTDHPPMPAQKTAMQTEPVDTPPEDEPEGEAAAQDEGMQSETPPEEAQAENEGMPPDGGNGEEQSEAPTAETSVATVNKDTPAEDTPVAKDAPLQKELFADVTAPEPPEPRPADKELASAKKALSECNRKRKQEAESFNRDAEALRQQIEALQQQQLAVEQEAAAQADEHSSQAEHLRRELKAAQEALRAAESKLKALEEKQTDTPQNSGDDVADLRKQTAFMKKNIAVLHAELDAVRRQSMRRAKIVLALSTILTAIAALLIIRLGDGCRRSEDGTGDRQASIASTQPGQMDPPGITPTPVPATPAPGETRSSAWPVIQVSGMNVVSAPGKLQIRFNKGAFSSLTTFSPEAAAQLKALAAQLGPHIGRYRLIVEGHTDNTPMRPTAQFADNAALAAARAEAAVTFLKRETGITAVAASTPGLAPYPNDTPENRSRNRTVVLQLLPLP